MGKCDPDEVQFDKAYIVSSGDGASEGYAKIKIVMAFVGYDILNAILTRKKAPPILVIGRRQLLIRDEQT